MLFNDKTRFWTKVFSPHIKLSLSSWVTLPALSEFKLFCHLEYDSYSGRTCWILEDLRKYTADKSLRTVTLSRLRLLLYFAEYPQFMSLSFHQKISSSSLIIWFSYLMYLIIIFLHVYYFDNVRFPFYDNLEV